MPAASVIGDQHGSHARNYFAPARRSLDRSNRRGSALDLEELRR